MQATHPRTRSMKMSASWDGINVMWLTEQNDDYSRYSRTSTAAMRLKQSIAELTEMTTACVRWLPTPQSRSLSQPQRCTDLTASCTHHPVSKHFSCSNSSGSGSLSELVIICSTSAAVATHSRCHSNHYHDVMQPIRSVCYINSTSLHHKIAEYLIKCNTTLQNYNPPAVADEHCSVSLTELSESFGDSLQYN